MSDQPLQKIAEGREAEIYAWDDGTVLRLLRNPNAGHQVEWEAAAMRAARDAGVRVPAVHGVTSVLDRPGLIMERVDGADLLTVLAQAPWRMFAIARVCSEAQALLHNVIAPEGIPTLREVLKRRIGSSDRVPRDLAEVALGLLEDLPDGDRVCHGDFHPANLVVSPDGPVIIDWTGVLRGDPHADFVRSMLLLRMAEPLPGTPALLLALIKGGRRVFAWRYQALYRRARPLDAQLVARWEVPVIANRLAEGIENERGRLLQVAGRAQRRL